MAESERSIVFLPKGGVWFMRCLPNCWPANWWSEEVLPFLNPARWRSPLSVVPRCSCSAARNNPDEFSQLRPCIAGAGFFIKTFFTQLKNGNNHLPLFDEPAGRLRRSDNC